MYTPLDNITNSPTYSGEKIIAMLTSLQKKCIKSKMNLVNRNILDTIQNKFDINKSLNKADTKVLWKFFMNFVMRDYIDIQN